MQKRYLIRKHDMTFIGPFSLSRLSRKHKQLNIFSADEISAGFGKWVKFEDISRMKRHYPELVDIAKDLMAGWGVTAGTVEKIKPIPKKNKTSIFGGLFSKLALLCLIATSVGLYYKSKKPEAYQKILAKIQLRSNHLQVLKDLESNGSVADLASYLQAHRVGVLKEAKRSKSNFNQMLKYIRVLAFQSKGSIDGIADAYLTGKLESKSLPKTCSEKSWKKRWKDSEEHLKSWVSGKQNIKDDWAKLLSWSPAWIKKRTTEDWVWPQNYYAACVLMAEKAYAGLAFDSLDETTYTMIKNRLSFMRSSLSNAATYAADEASYEEGFSYLNQLTCLEMSESNELMDDCFVYNSPDPSFDEMLIFRKSWLTAGVLVQKLSNGDEGSLEALQQTADTIEVVNEFIGLSYDQEKNFLKKVVDSMPGDVVETIRNELKVHPGVEYSH